VDRVKDRCLKMGKVETEVDNKSMWIIDRLVWLEASVWTFGWMS
jgi:hypothetical protein